MTKDYCETEGIRLHCAEGIHCEQMSDILPLRLQTNASKGVPCKTYEAITQSKSKQNSLHSKNKNGLINGQSQRIRPKNKITKQHDLTRCENEESDPDYFLPIEPECEKSETEGSTSTLLRRSECTVRGTRRKYEKKYVQNETVNHLEHSHAESLCDNINSCTLKDSENIQDDIDSITDSVSSLHVHESASCTYSLDEDPSDDAESQKNCNDCNCVAYYMKLTSQDYGKITKKIFSSEIVAYVVHTALDGDENKIDIYVEAGRLEETETYLKESFCNFCCVRHVFDVMEGATVELAGELSANSDASEVNKNLVIGDSLSHIKSGTNISHPDATKVQLTENGWNFREGVDKAHVKWTHGTVGAIFEQKTTKRLWLVTTGHTYQQKWGFEKGTASTDCTLLSAGKHMNNHLSNKYVSFMGEDEEGNGIDVAAIPLFENIQCNKYIKPYFGHGLSPDGKHVQDKENIELSIYTDPSEDLIGRCIQKRGAVTGYTRGKIIKTGSHVKIKIGGEERFIGNCIIIGSDEEVEFAANGDSGAFIIDDQKVGTDKKAIAIFFCILTNCYNYKSPDTGQTYKRVFASVRLDQSIKRLENGPHKLALSLYTPPHGCMVTGEKRPTDEGFKRPLRHVRSKSDNNKPDTTAQIECRRSNTAISGTIAKSTDSRKRKSWDGSKYPSISEKSSMQSIETNNNSNLDQRRRNKMKKQRKSKYNTYPSQKTSRCVSLPTMNSMMPQHFKSGSDGCLCLLKPES